MCAATSTFDPGRHDDAEFATIFEGVDAPDHIGTPYTMSVGDSFVGSISSTADTMDVVAIQLIAGQSYSIDLSGLYGGGGTLSDAYVFITNSSGTTVGANDDGAASAWIPS
jgi:serralysin